MKKNVVRVLSLLLVASMLFAFASCTQKIEIRFVDKDGNDISLGGAVPANNDATETPATDAPATDTPATDAPVTDAPSEGEATDAPATQAPATDTPATDAPATQAPATDAPATDAPATQAPAPTSSVPSTKEEIIEFYKNAVNNIRDNGVASYNKKEYQTIATFNITGNSMVDGVIKNIAGNYFKDESKAELQTAKKGEDSSKSKILGWTLTDYSKVKSATLKQNGGNYEITIVMVDEDTPTRANGFLPKVGSVLIWEDLEKELKTISQLSEWEGNIHVVYTNYTIKAVVSPDGKFSSIKHHTDVAIKIGHAKILIVKLDNKAVTMANDCVFSNFAY
ncbi:MAG: hypothetical protein IJS90_10245 [Clostridia bacterium]|nr:hypothetical protein [Clostridia bacterium]